MRQCNELKLLKSFCCSLCSFLEHVFAGQNNGGAVQHGDSDHRSPLRTLSIFCQASDKTRKVACHSAAVRVSFWMAECLVNIS